MKDLSFLKTNLIAHRGFHNIDIKIPENSISAFKRALRNNLIIELDVHLLKDGNIVVFHDDNLKRLCNVDKNINDCTYDEIKTLKILNTNNYIPLLKNVLKIVNGKVPLLIETKYYCKYGVLEKALMKLLESYNGPFAIQSFYPKSLYWFKKNNKEVPIGLLIHNLNDSKMFKTIFNNYILKTDFLSYDVRGIPNNYIDRKKNKELVLGWTIKNKKDYDNYKDYFDNLICENIEELKL